MEFLDRGNAYDILRQQFANYHCKNHTQIACRNIPLEKIRKAF